jgi:hypothetical protein
LINSFFLPQGFKNKTTAEKYDYLCRKYNAGHTYILLNNVNVFGPYLQPEVPWDISEAEKIAKYDPEVAKTLNWINANIVIKLSSIDDKTMGVLVRIATGMLNKCNIPKSLQIMFHDNMVKNLQAEHLEIVMSDLPF